MNDKLAVIDVEAEFVEVTTTPLARSAAPLVAEKLRVIEIIAIDYIWNEEKNGFFPVFGAPHAGRPILNVEPRKKLCPKSP